MISELTRGSNRIMLSRIFQTGGDGALGFVCTMEISNIVTRISWLDQLRRGSAERVLLMLLRRMRSYL